MPFAFILVGILLLVSGVRKTSTDLVGLIKSDFTGSDNFIYWLASILVIGSVGYIDQFKALSRAFMVLVIVILILTDGQGFFSQFNSALNQISSDNKNTTQQAQSNSSTLSSLAGLAGLNSNSSTSSDSSSFSLQGLSDATGINFIGIN